MFSLPEKIRRIPSWRRCSSSRWSAAFKHGVSNDRPSFIDIDIREEEGVLACRIENSFFPKSEADRSGSGIEYQNLCRLEMIYPGRYEMKYGQHGDTYETLLRINLTDR